MNSFPAHRHMPIRESFPVKCCISIVVNTCNGNKYCFFNFNSLLSVSFREDLRVNMLYQADITQSEI